MTAISFRVNGDEWWLKPEHQPEHETKTEWRSRTFAMRYGRRDVKLSDRFGSGSTLRDDSVDPSPKG